MMLLLSAYAHRCIVDVQLWICDGEKGMCGCDAKESDMVMLQGVFRMEVALMPDQEVAQFGIFKYGITAPA